jgi:hypothetical protein
MENTSINKFMELLTPLSVEMKLDIVSRLSEQVKTDFKAKNKSK